MRRAKAPKGSALELFAIGGAMVAGLIFYWRLVPKTEDKGESLWKGLGFPYGATGNLTGIAGQFFTGNITGANINGAALPVIMAPGQLISAALTSTLTGDILTDTPGSQLTDLPHIGPPTLVTPVNNSGRNPIVQGQGPHSNPDFLPGDFLAGDFAT